MKDALLSYVKRVKALHEKVRGNEEATKMSLIGPLFTLLGYDLTDPQECVPEFKADFGKTRSVKPVDWAFYQNTRPIFLVEAKDSGTKLGGYDEQLGDYFAKEPDVKLGVLTNGVMWRFFTDIIHLNVMDKEPFVKWDVLKDEQPPYDFLTLLQKSQFKTELVRTFAQRRYEHNLLVNELARLLEPSPEFTRLAVANIETRNLTPNVIESWKPVVASAIGEWAKQRTLASVLTRSPAQDETESPTEQKGEQGHGTLAALIRAGVLVPPLSLFCKYKGTRLEATLLPDGAVEFKGQRYDTPSGAAEAARATVSGQRMNTNGWTFWQYQGTGGKKLTLRDARQQVVSPHRKGASGHKGQKAQPERDGLRKKFWQALLDRPKMKGTRHADIAPGVFSWIGAGSGVRGLPFRYVIRKTEGEVDLYIDRGAGKTAENKDIFDRLQKHKEEIERTFGGALSWQRLDDKQGCRIAHTISLGGYRSPEAKWPAIHDAMIDAMSRLEKTLAPRLEKLKTELNS
jgi:hypothetical protein